MRAIGTSVRQLNLMVAAETVTYLVSGLFTGLIFGLPLHRFLYYQVITSRWGDKWSLPLWEFGTIAVVMIVSAIFAIAGPVRRIRRISVVENIHAE